MVKIAVLDTSASQQSDQSHILPIIKSDCYLSFEVENNQLSPKGYRWSKLTRILDMPPFFGPSKAETTEDFYPQEKALTTLLQKIP